LLETSIIGQNLAETTILMNKAFITTAEAAEILGVSPSRVRQFILEGRLKSQKIGRDQLLIKKDVDIFAAEPRYRTGRPTKNIDMS
jgi:excisionase family DNA binding protein